MKKSGLLLIFGAILFLASCADKPTRPGTLLSEGQKAAADAAATAAANSAIQGAPAGVGNLPHYYCANGCEGSGGDSQGTCPTCGTAYTHNAAFHNQAPTPPTVGGTAPSNVQTISTPPIGTVNGVNNTTPLTPTQATTPEPPQNANGVWHYTCSAGCSGGAGGAGSCSQCGGALAHNAAYHN